MSSQEIKTLRQQGRLEEALDMARSELETMPDDIWRKINLAWVYDAYCKKYAEEGNHHSFRENIKAIIGLQILSDNDYLNDTLCWRFFALMRKCSATLQQEKLYALADDLFSMAQHLNLSKPSEAYTILFKTFYMLKEQWPGYLTFCNWWGLDNFRQEDYLCEQMNNGKTMPISLAEGAYLAYSRSLMLTSNTERIKRFLPKMEALNERHPELVYVGYYLGKLFLCAGGDKNEALKALIPFVKKKCKEFWAWQLLAEAVKGDDDKVLACLLRGVNCPAQENFLVKMRYQIAELLIKKRYYAEARIHIEKYIACKKENNNKIPIEVIHWTDENWFKEAQPISPKFRMDYMGITNEILHPDCFKPLGIVVAINKENKSMDIVWGKKVKSSIKIPPVLGKIRIGDFIEFGYEPDFETKESYYVCI